MPARPNTLEVLTITPSSCSARMGRKARVPLTTPSKLICRSHSSSSGSASSTDEATATPALLKTAASGALSASEGSHWRTSAAKRRWSAVSRTSSTRTSTGPGSVLAVSFSPASSMSAMAAGEPRPDSRRARLRPMPEAAPVIITGRPASGLTGFPASGPNCLPASRLTARAARGLRFMAMGTPPPVLIVPALAHPAVRMRTRSTVRESTMIGKRRDSVTAASTARAEAGLAGTAPAEFRRRLLEGMAAAIRETGYRDATVADVVRHARTSRRTFYEHFPSKQACFIDLLREANAAMVRQIGAAVDRRARWDVQVRQSIEAWIAVAQSDLALTLSWIRDLPSLGADARHLQREWLEAFIVLVRELNDTPELRAAGVAPPSRQLLILMLGGLRELIATTVEDGGDIGGITDVAVRATQAMLGPPPRPAPE